MKKSETIKIAIPKRNYEHFEHKKNYRGATVKPSKKTYSRKDKHKKGIE